MNEPSERRSSLLRLKLGALVTHRWPVAIDETEPGSFPDGATLLDRSGHRLWVLIDDGDDAEHRLGGVLAVARRDGATEVHVIAEDPGAGAVLARRAALFAMAPEVWRTDGLDLRSVDAAPPAPIEPPSPEAELYRPVLEAAGLQAVVEGGHLLGERLGLEVARVIDDGTAPAHVEAGVGRFDREAGAMMFAELGETDAVARVVELVTRLRSADAARHPLNQLVPERWLRSVLVARPDLVGASVLAPVGSALPRRNLMERGVATAVGADVEGRPLVVTCSTGVDLDLVASAADDRSSHAPGARLVLAVPARDAVAVTRDLAGALADPAEVVGVDEAWRTLAPEAR
jgi:hypothetical protein